MRPLRYLGLALIIAGLVMAMIGAVLGGIGLTIFLFIPVFEVRSALAAIGILMLMAGLFLSFFSPFLSAPDVKMDEKGQTEQNLRRIEKRSAGVILIGPIPIVWGSDNRLALLATVICLIVLAMAIFLFAFRP